MARRKKYGRKSVADINITPLVDVILVLLIIFMISSPMLTTGFDVSLPKASASALSVESKQVVVNVRQNGSLSIDGKRVANLTKYLQDGGYDSNTQIFIGGDKNVKYGSVVSVMSSLNSSGYKSVSLVTEDIDD